jgi:hypothetical protein
MPVNRLPQRIVAGNKPPHRGLGSLEAHCHDLIITFRIAFDSQVRPSDTFSLSWEDLMRLFYMIVALTLSLAGPVCAKNFAFPESNPTATVAIPNSWKTESIEYGFEARSPDNDVYLSIESVSAKAMDKMLNANMAWMKTNKIKVTGKPKENDVNFGGLPGKMQTFPATDENGDTQIILVFAESEQRLIFITLWASEEEQKANDKDINAIMGSIKAIQ